MSEQAITKPTRPSYTDAEVRKALEIHAAVSGRQDLVAKLLKDEELDIKVATVRDWATRRKRDLYQDIRQGIVTTIRTTAADRYKAVTDLALDVMDEALKQTADALKRGELQPKDLPKVAQNAAVTAGIGTDKSQLLDGQPTEIVTGGNPLDSVRELASMGITVFVPAADGRPVPIETTAKDKRPALSEHVDDEDDDDQS
jgi:hypothetical protein